MAFQRAQVAALVQRLSGRPTFIHALFGPRQTGKTTIRLKALNPDFEPIVLTGAGEGEVDVVAEFVDVVDPA